MKDNAMLPVQEEQAETHDNYPDESFESQEDFGFKLKPDSLFHDWQGQSVMVFGVLLPALMIGCAAFTLYDRITLLLLKQPLETIVELALVLSVPAGNFIVWRALCKGDCRSTIKRGILNGVAAASAAIITLISGIAAALHYPTLSGDGTGHGAEFTLISLVSLGALASALYLAHRVRQTRVIRSSQIRAMVYATIGAVVALSAFIASEARSTVIRIAELMAVSESQDEKDRGLDLLRSLNARRDISMECASPRAGGLAGMFARIDNVSLRQLFFCVTGEPFRDDKSANFASMPDEYLQKHVVGAPVEGLSLHRSKMHGYVNPGTLTSTIYWTFVFKNKSYEPVEARAELGLPEGSAISGMTMWRGGSPMETVFAPSGDPSNAAATHWTNVGHDAPAIVTDLGRDRVLLHCYPVPAQGQLKMAVAITVPMSLETLDRASLPLPRFIDTNFSLKGKHQIRMVADQEIGLASKSMTASRTPAGKYVVAGNLDSDTLSGISRSLSVSRQATLGPVAVRDEFSESPRYITQTIRKIPAVAPRHLVVVMDGSMSLKPYVDDLKEALSRSAKSIPTSFILARNSEEPPAAVSLEKALKTLKSGDFEGGQDNLESLVKATELAGEEPGGAVLWIHGPQPSFNKEIYIVSPASARPSFYELALDNGVMDPSEFFKHHSEIGPFQPIARSGSAADKLNGFLSQWKPGGCKYQVEYAVSDRAPALALTTGDQAREIAALFARETCALALSRGDAAGATREAVYHRIVTPVSLASTRFVSQASTLGNSMHNQSVHIVNGADKSAATAENASEGEDLYFMGSAPTLQGATNGTIGPQSTDAVMGVNTAGTVRINNLANLEAMLNLFANGIQILGILGGVALMASGILDRAMEKWSTSRLACGLLMILAGLASPGVISYFVSSARDANLFS